MSLPETIKKVGVEIVVFSLSGVISVVGSYVLIKRVLPQAWFQGETVAVVAAPADAHAAEGQKAAESHKEGTKPKEDHGKEKPKGHGEGKEEKEEGVNVPLKSVIVNLADTNVRRFGKVSLSLQVKDPKVVEDLKKVDPQIYDTLIKVLSHFKYEEISSLDGKELFKEEVKNRINVILKDDVVTSVFITELIVQ
ncbi:MAG: flagellar basal body-associated protein FliL [Elusimicrobiota bacterium]